jgi:hypothetical protein
MILIESGMSAPETFEAKLLFASVLAELGHRPVLDETTLPDDLSTDLRYQAAPYLTDLSRAAPDRIVVIGAGHVDDLRSTALRAVSGGLSRVGVIGRFPNRELYLNSVARIAHATGREPAVCDLSSLQPNGWPCLTDLPMVGLPPVAGSRKGSGAAGVVLWLSPERLDDPAERAALFALAQDRRLDLALVLPGNFGEQINDLTLLGIPAYRDTELSPRALARIGDIVVLDGQAHGSPRAAQLALTAMLAGRPVVDMSFDAVFAFTGAPVLRAAPTLAALAGFLTQTVLPDRSRIARSLSGNAWLRTCDPSVLSPVIGEPALPPKQPTTPATKLHFVPTNGVGLGHVRRTLLLADALPQGTPVSFFAYGGCIRAVEARGRTVTPLVSHSVEHGAVNAADIVNSLRMGRSVGPDDVVVFDGGYVYDSVLRTLSDTGARGVWIRRGLWQPGQATPVLMSREKAFARVIVPGEVFAELDRPMTFGPKVARVGPVVASVHQTDKERRLLRDRLAEIGDCTFDRLVVSMLGGGVAADREAQLQYLSGLLERRSDTLHVIVVWPGAVVAPALYQWQRTRVVQTLQAAALAQAADLVVSAAGYNSFHEAIYNRVPTIFVPQMAPYMDDQAARAAAASRRHIAEAVAASDLSTLGRTTIACLDGRAEDLRSRLAALDLPATGTAEAAALIDDLARGEVPE